MDDLECEARAFSDLEDMRWGVYGDDDPHGEIRCPHCKVKGRAFYLRPKNGVSRPTRTGARSARRVWKCGACRKQFSVFTGTGLERTKLSARDWDMVLGKWIAVCDAELRTPTIEDIATTLPRSRRHSVFRAWYTVAHCDDDDDFLVIYRDWDLHYRINDTPNG